MYFILKIFRIWLPSLFFMLGIIFSPTISFAQNLINVPLISQLPELKNGCEVTSLAMLLQYKGINVSKMTLANQVVKDPTPYRVVGGTVYWGNPNTGFVGDITGRSLGYSAYHGPIFQLASRYTNVIDLTGNPFDVILQQLAKGKPVWVISTSTFNTVPYSQWQTIQTPIGPLTMTFHEHSVVLTGYDNNYVYFNDPLANIKNRAVSRSNFINGWQQFGSQAITFGSSIGVMDNPVSNMNLSGSYRVSGWFLDESGVNKVEVLVDGNAVGQAVYGDPRADVQNVYPEYNNGNSGFHFDLDTSQFRNGTHTVTVRETGNNGYVNTLANKNVVFSNAIGVIDTPAANETIKGNYNLKGWFLDDNGVTKVEVLLDGSVIGEAVYGDARPDVKKVYPEFNNDHAGFHYAFDTTSLSDGAHRITVRETGANGKVTTLPEKTFVISNIRGYLDRPVSGKTLSGTSTVDGWFLDENGVAKIEVLLDGTVAGEAVYGDSRPDVKNVYPEFNNANAGYHYVFDSTQYSNGTHKISVRETSKNGRVTTLPEKDVTISNIVYGYLDKPADWKIIKGSNEVSGWFLDRSGVAKVEILVDGTVTGEAVYGDSRPDVQKVFPEYNNGNAGYHYTLDTVKLSDGVHKISVRETGKNGRTTTLPEKTVVVSNVRGFLDRPVSGSTLSGKSTLDGWFLDESGVAKIEVLLDGTVAGEAVYGDARPDVKNVYPEFNNANAGYHFVFDSTQYSNGAHKMSVRETSKNGQVTTLPEKEVTISNIVYGYLDNPVDWKIIKGSNTVSGWFLDRSGVAKVEILVDGTVTGEAVYGDSRPDVQKVFPEYNNGNAGYHYTLDTLKFSDGVHKISVRETGKNGRTTTLPEKTIVVSNVRGFLDRPVSGSTLSGKATLDGWFLDESGVAKIEVLLDGIVAGEAVYGDSRTDVKNVYPEFNNANAGYHYTIDTTKLSNGTHMIIIRETGLTGKVTELPERSVTILNTPALK